MNFVKRLFIITLPTLFINSVSAQDVVRPRADSLFMEWLLQLNDYEIGAFALIITGFGLLVGYIWTSHTHSIRDLKEDLGGSIMDIKNDLAKDVEKIEQDLQELERDLQTISRAVILNANYRHRVRTHGAYIRDIIRKIIADNRSPTVLQRQEDHEKLEMLELYSRQDQTDEKEERRAFNDIQQEKRQKNIGLPDDYYAPEESIEELARKFRNEGRDTE